MEVQPQLVLLQKTLLNVEGMGRQIYPDLDLWETAAPLMEEWMSEQMGLKGLFKRLGRSAPRWLEKLPELPDVALDAINELQQLGEANREHTRILSRLSQQLDSQTKSRRYSRLGGVALIAALIAAIVPLTGYAATTEAVIGSSLLGTLGIYWVFIRP